MSRSPKPARVPATRPQADDDHPDPIDLYDTASLTLNEAHALTQYLTDRLDDLWVELGSREGSVEAYALHLLARHVGELHDRLKGQLEALHPALIVALKASA